MKNLVRNLFNKSFDIVALHQRLLVFVKILKYGENLEYSHVSYLIRKLLFCSFIKTFISFLICQKKNIFTEMTHLYCCSVTVFTVAMYDIIARGISRETMASHNHHLLLITSTTLRDVHRLLKIRIRSC